MNDISDDELLEASRRAQERWGAVRAKDAPMPTLASAVGKPLAGAPVRVRCPRCEAWCYPLELEHEPRCEGCRRRDADRLEFIERMRLRIPEVYRVGTLERPPSFLPDEPIRAAQAWLRGSKRILSIFGPQTGSGKSTLAGCAASSAAERGIAVRWVHAVDLADEEPEQARVAFKTLRTSPLVVVDGCGKEMGHGRNAAFWESYEADALRKTMIRAFTHIHQSKGQRFVLTFDLSVDVLWKNAYDASIMRRIMNEEFADVITLRRNGELRVTPGGRTE